MAEPIEHIAGPAGLKQVCTRCGYVLQDFTGSGWCSESGKPPGSWAEGGRVIVQEFAGGKLSGTVETWAGEPPIVCTVN